jgi:hypothetical protein
MIISFFLLCCSLFVYSFYVIWVIERGSKSIFFDITPINIGVCLILQIILMILFVNDWISSKIYEASWKHEVAYYMPQGYKVWKCEKLYLKAKLGPKDLRKKYCAVFIEEFPYSLEDNIINVRKRFCKSKVRYKVVANLTRSKILSSFFIRVKKIFFKVKIYNWKKFLYFDKIIREKILVNLELNLWSRILYEPSLIINLIWQFYIFNIRIRQHSSCLDNWSWPVVFFFFCLNP